MLMVASQHCSQHGHLHPRPVICSSEGSLRLPYVEVLVSSKFTHRTSLAMTCSIHQRTTM